MVTDMEGDKTERTIRPGQTGQEAREESLRWREQPGSEQDSDRQDNSEAGAYPAEALSKETMALGTTVCPNCGAPIEADADFCEACKHYVRTNVCSFCGARLSPDDTFCPECGNPKGGIICPHCHTLNDFSFCKNCGAPLTEEARQMAQQLRATDNYRHMQELADGVARLDNCIPWRNEEEWRKQKANDELRERVLKLLAEDEGITLNESKKDKKEAKRQVRRMSAAELAKAKADLEAQLAKALDEMATPATPSPAKARNYAMAVKPAGVRMGWVCNYKHALHSSPCGCAKPQLGGKWVMLGRKTTNFTTDD